MISDEEAKKMTEEWKDEIKISGNVLPKNTDRGPNDLEATIERLEFKNEKLHNHNKKMEEELIELRLDNKRLAKQCEEQMQQFRNKGEM